MEKKEQKHLYADTVEQNKRANHFLASEESAQLDIPL